MDLYYRRHWKPGEILKLMWEPRSSCESYIKSKMIFFFFPVLLRKDWHTSLYQFKVYSMIVWLTYIVKLYWKYTVFALIKLFTIGYWYIAIKNKSYFSLILVFHKAIMTYTLLCPSCFIKSYVKWGALSFTGSVFILM